MEENKLIKTNQGGGMQKFITAAAIIAFFVGIIFGGIAGAISGAFSDDYIQPWLEQAFGHNLFSDDSDDFSRTLQVEEESATVSAVEKASPAVVSIVVTKELTKYYNATGPNIFPFDIFGFDWPFAFEREGQEPQEKVKKEVGGGTGFIVTSDGLIVTNRHVVADESAEYTVVLNDGTKHDAEVIALDPFLDLAIVKIEGEDLPTLELGDSDNIKIGQTVIAIGNVLSEYSNTVTRGVISGINRRVVAGNSSGGSEVIEEAIQTDAAINPGNSGGPLLNLVGQVVGVNTAVSQQGQLVGFAIPINSAKKIVESVKEHGRIVRPWLGVRYVVIDEGIAKENNLEVDYGALIVRGSRDELAIIPGSPADKAGLVENDIILEIEGERIDEQHSLARMIARYNPGDTITLKIYHKGEEKTLRVILEEYTEQIQDNDQ